MEWGEEEEEEEEQQQQKKYTYVLADAAVAFVQHAIKRLI
jgi:hypothetical protein